MAWQELQPYHPYPESPLLDSSSCPQKLCRNASDSSSSSRYLALESILSKHRESVSSSSSSSICEPDSPMERRLSATTTDTVGLDLDTDAGTVSSEEPWNLVAYHVPWGPGYEGYETGSLPGPDGTCIFLRSPTPLKRQRTSQACDKCRERKAKCSGSRPSCVRCLSRDILCVYSPSTAADAHSTSPRASHRRQSHSGLSALKPQHLKVSTRTRLGRKDSVADHEISGSVHGSSSELMDTSYCTAFCNSIPTDLDDDSSTFSRLSLFGDDSESPVEPHTPSPFVSSPKANPSPHKFADDTSRSLYMHPLEALEAYRFPPEDKQMGISMLQPPSATPSIPMYTQASSGMGNPGDSLLLSDVPLSSELDALWDDRGFFEDSGTFLGDLFPEPFTNNTLGCTVNDEYSLDNAFPL